MLALAIVFFINIYFFLNGDTVFIAEEHNLFKTLNNGHTWARQDMGISIYNIQFLNDSVGYVFGGKKNTSKVTEWILFKTTNGGPLDINSLESTHKPNCIYPNPFSDDLNISLVTQAEGDVVVDVCSVNGISWKTIFKRHFPKGEVSFYPDTKATCRGTSILRITINNNIYYCKVVKL